MFGDLQNNEKRRGLREFITNAITLIKDVDRFRDSFALVVINSDDEQDDSYTIIDIAYDLRKIAYDFRNKANVLKFIRTLHNRSEEGVSYPRLGVLWRANQTGSVLEMSLSQKERKRISYILHDSIKYTKINESYFGYPISNSSIDHIPNLIKAM